MGAPSQSVLGIKVQIRWKAEGNKIHQHMNDIIYSLGNKKKKETPQSGVRVIKYLAECNQLLLLNTH